MRSETINACWKNLWPEVANDRKGFFLKDHQRAAVNRSVRLPTLRGGEGFKAATEDKFEEPVIKGSPARVQTAPGTGLTYCRKCKPGSDFDRTGRPVSALQYWRLYLLTLVLGIGGSFQVGVQYAIIPHPEVHVHKFVNQTWISRYGVPVADSTNQLIWSFIVSVFSLGGLAGALTGTKLAVTYGRKKTLWLNNILAVVAALLVLFSRMAESFEMILLSRIIFGFNNGVGLNVHLMYIGECSPNKLRGFLTSTVSIFAVFGKVFGQIIGIKEILGSEEMWPYLLAISGLPAILQFVTLPFFPEAARYLYIDKGDVDGTKKSLRWLWQEDSLKMVLEDMQKEKESKEREEIKTIKDVLTSQCVRWQLMTLILPCSLVNFCGITALYFYAFDIFRTSGVPEGLIHYLTIGIGMTELISVIIGSFLLGCASKKRMVGSCYVLSGITMSILTVTLSIKHLASWIPYVSIALIFLFVWIFGLGPAGGCLSLPADIFLQAWRPPAYVILGIIFWLSVFILGMTFGYTVDGLGQYCFLFFVTYCILSGSFVLRFVPETNGKAIMEITEEYNKLNYKNKSTDDSKNIDKIR
ncbi:solute carrier family 2, facilitated glucose transporter member 11-like [Brachionichthys hirsutus]|uniref:solute carrier family 2, facilitated glucose transporter member 11-like n=1 Tax=Brachionichthys hirsutus TaxID=412623 RepID=UPI0036044F1B